MLMMTRGSCRRSSASSESSFGLQTAPSGAEGLEAIASDGPFAVVVSDMRMPGMDGIQFLSQVKAQAPESVRIMLTGNGRSTDGH